MRRDPAPPPAPYRGPDRRVDRSRDPRSRTGLELLVLIGGIVTAVEVAVNNDHLVSLGALHVVIATATTLTCLTAAGLAWVSWRLAGDARAAYLGIGLLLYGSIAVPLGLTRLDASKVAGWHATPIIAGFTALVSMLAALRAPDVDGTIRFTRRYLLGALVVFGTGGLIAALDPNPLALRIADSALAAGMAGLAVTFVRAGRRTGRPMLARTGLGLLAVGAGYGWLVLGPGRDPQTVVVAGLLVLAGTGTVLAGLIPEARAAFTVRGRDAGTLRARWQAAEDRAHGMAAEQEERVHEIRTALVSIEGATSTLHRHRDQLGAADATELVRAVSAEIRRLQQLVTPHPSGAPGSRPDGHYDPVEVIGPLVRTEQAGGRAVHLVAEPGLRVRGQPQALAETVSNLLVNARVHAPEATVQVTVRAPADTDRRVRVTVEDDGPGLPEGGAELVFTRGWRAETSADRPGSGLGLFLASRLIERQGGTLSVEPTPRGARFRIDLPAPEISRASWDGRTGSGAGA